MLGHADEFKAIYLEYENLVMKIAVDYVHDFYTAQDICQEAFLRLHHYYKEMTPEKIKNFLAMITRNLAIDVLRKGGKYKEVVGLPPLDEAPVNMGDFISPEQYIENENTRTLIREAFETLREKNAMWHDVLFMIEVMEMPRKLVAAEHGIALSTLDGYLKRAKKWMKKHLGDLYEEL